MQLSSLRYVLEVERTGSITQAAKNLYMGQPNLSKAIKELERDIGVTLFARTAKGVVPTAQGEQFLNYARTIISQMDELENMYRPPAAREIHLNICVPRDEAVLAAFSKFVQEQKGCYDLTLHEEDALSSILSIATGECSFGVIRLQSLQEEYYFNRMREKGILWEPVWEFRMMLLFSAQHPLASEKEILYHMLGAYPEIVCSEQVQSPIVLTQVRKGACMAQERKRITVTDRLSQLYLLRQVEGAYAWVSSLSQEKLREHGLVQRRCALSGMVYHDYFIYPDSGRPSDLQRRFLTILREEIQALGIPSEKSAV